MNLYVEFSLSIPFQSSDCLGNVDPSKIASQILEKHDLDKVRCISFGSFNTRDFLYQIDMPKLSFLCCYFCIFVKNFITEEFNFYRAVLSH